jgi:ribonucleotide reductase beta subunit family protein with ferritin-like domain
LVSGTEKPNILLEKKEYVFEYPQAIKFAEMQSDIIWTEKEIVLDKDLIDLHGNLTEAELHGVTTVLKLFTEYELRVGKDFWLGVMMDIFKRPEFQRMFAVFGATELNSHAPFYAKINEILGLASTEFYRSYTKDHTLKSRMSEIHNVIYNQDHADPRGILRTVGGISIVEGGVLYSNFAYLKHFQAEGKSKLINLVGGINYSVRDENLHSIAGSWVFRTLREESKLSLTDTAKLEKDTQDFCHKTREHEHRIIDMIFEAGPIKGLTDHQLKNFVDSRLDLCLEQLGFNKIYNVEYNPIARWFYKNIQLSELHDFFAKQGKEYNRDWKKANFKWITDDERNAVPAS